MSNQRVTAPENVVDVDGTINDTSPDMCFPRQGYGFRSLSKCKGSLRERGIRSTRSAFTTKERQTKTVSLKLFPFPGPSWLRRRQSRVLHRQRVVSSRPQPHEIFNKLKVSGTMVELGARSKTDHIDNRGCRLGDGGRSMNDNAFATIWYRLHDVPRTCI